MAVLEFLLVNILPAWAGVGEDVVRGEDGQAEKQVESTWMERKAAAQQEVARSLKNKS